MEDGFFEKSAGHLSFKADSSGNSSYVVNEIATLLTSGRMSNEKRTYLQNVYDSEQDKDIALRRIEELMIFVPEFHGTGLDRQKPTIKKESVKQNLKSCKPYKAVIHLMLYGGMDSFNLLAPHSGCNNNRGYDHYKSERGAAGMSLNELLPISAIDSSQPCNTYGIHYKLPILKELYERNELSFVAGIGVMTEMVTKDNYSSKTVTQLFAHDKSK